MSYSSLIPELEDVIQQGSPERRAETLKRITAFFLDGASRFNEDHVRLFDEVFSRLITEIETKARSELSHRLAPVGNAPVDVVRRLAQDDDIAVAGPVLKQSPRLAETDLVDIAQTKSQAHLLAISERPGIAEPVTDVLVRRGGREVVHRVADNRDARFSNDSFFTLVDRAEKDGVLAEKVGLRPDIPPRLLRDLLLKATEMVQQRLFASAKPETQAEIRRVLAKVSHEVAAKAAPRDYSAAATHGRGAASGRQAQRDDARRLRRQGAIRGNGRGARLSLRGADRGGASAHGRRPARSGPHSLQVGGLGMADGEGNHHVAIGRRPEHVEPKLRHRLREFRAVVADYRPARDALLATAAGGERTIGSASSE